MVAIGDRDYRTDASRRAVLRTHAGRAKTDAYRLDFKLLLWDANEIENYLLDRTAMLSALDRQADERQIGKAWETAAARVRGRTRSASGRPARARTAVRGDTHPAGGQKTRVEHCARPGRPVPDRAVEGTRTVV